MRNILLFGFLLFTTVAGHAQIINTYAGTGASGYTGDGGAATAAKLNVQFGVAADAAGNLFIADYNNHCIRKVNPAGFISTVAGNGTLGFGGDGGTATAAQLSYPTGVAIDGSGNLYIADFANSRIRRVDPAGIITTVAGNTSGYSGDGGAATAAQLNQPYALAFDGSGNLYIGDVGNNRIRKITTAGIISTFAGNGTTGFSGDGAAATAAQLYTPYGLAADDGGNLYIADFFNNRIRMVSPAGIISTVAGTGPGSFFGDGGPATAARLNSPSGVAVDGSGNLFIADVNNNRIRKVNPAGIISTVAGTSSYGLSGDGGAATAAQLNNPRCVTVDNAGNLYITDFANDRIRIVACMTTPFLADVYGPSAVCQGGTISVADSIPGGVWSISGPATVDAAGTVTGVAGGTAIISYTLNGACGTSEAVYAVTVNPLPGAGRITGADSVCVGDSVTLLDDVSGGVWTSGTPDATVSATGAVSGVNVGLTLITYTVSNSCGSQDRERLITIYDCTAGIHDMPGASGVVTVYPDPATEKVNIEMPNGNSSFRDIKIFDALGRTHDVSALPEKNKVIIDVSGLAPGFYTVRYTYGDVPRSGIFLKK
jgi:sugar lactone lactonase YvrE